MSSYSQLIKRAVLSNPTARIGFIAALFFQLWLPYSSYQSHGILMAIVAAIFYFPVFLLAFMWNAVAEVSQGEDIANNLP